MKVEPELLENYDRFWQRCEVEGIEYTCVHYSDWVEEFKDKDDELMAYIVQFQQAQEQLQDELYRINDLLKENGYE